MSATGRGAVRKPSDFYPTPGWCVRRLLEACPLPGGSWLEPGAGTGAIIRAVNGVRRDVVWTAVEVVAEREAELAEVVKPPGIVGIADFLRTTLSRSYAVAIGNPPFSEARPFVDAALAHAEHVAFLLRLAFLEAAERAEWWQTHPADVYVLPDRPSFTDGGTDSSAYAWFHWTRGRTEVGRVKVLPVTPEAEKALDRGQMDLFMPGATAGQRGLFG